MNRIDVIYARQSVDKKDSISIETQEDFCKHETKGGNYRVYSDKGYSGKNTDRPKFQELVQDIEQGLVGRVIVYKLDRISRSIIDFANIMELFARYDVEFISTAEKFDTSTPMGRAMLNICIVFAQLERETIQKRVQDAYYARCQKGYFTAGYAPSGFRLEPTTLDGIKTKRMAEKPEEAEQIRLIFDMYADPAVSFGDISRYFTERGIKINGREVTRLFISYVLRNPVYVQADLSVYEFYKSQGTTIVNDPADFNGLNACYLYQGRDVKERKYTNLKDQILVVAPHEGIVPAETWLSCRIKLLSNAVFSSGRKVKRTWLAGKMRCGLCGASLACTGKNNKYYFHCRKRIDRKSCDGCGTLRMQEVEHAIYGEMLKRMERFQTLTGGDPQKANPKLTALHVELAQVDGEIEKLLDTLISAGSTLVDYANGKIEELDARRQTLIKEIADTSIKTMSAAQMERISANLNDWENLTFEDRRLVVDGLIETIRAKSGTVEIDWNA